MANTYVLVNLAVIIGPLVLSFDRKVGFYRHWGSLGVSLGVVSCAYIVWDVLATRAGHWSFDPEFAGSMRLVGLPVGEILFFIAVPYACIFTYAVVRVYFKERLSLRTLSVRAALFSVAAVTVVLAVLTREQGYTALALASVAAMLVVTAAFDPAMWSSVHTLLCFFFSFVLFLVANGVLTALPIVQYNPEAIWGVRIYTIPLEDFFYNLGLLGFYLFFYRLAGRR